MFAPDKGMNLISYRLGDIEVIDQTTTPLFHERSAGLGALIGPHFHHRENPLVNFDTSLLPHIAAQKAKGVLEPFSHGIARYVPWKFAKSTTQVKAHLHGSDLYQNIPLKAFEGQDFEISFEARLLTDGLFIEYKVTSEFPSVLGLHYYYRLSGKGNIHGLVQDSYRDQNTWSPLKEEWIKDDHFHFTLPQKADFGFLPKRKAENETDFHLNLNAPDYSLHLDYNAASDKEISCQIFHPENASYVCIEPLSAKDPTKPTLSRSTLEAKLQIFNP